jgi:hypothetical protein
MALIEEPRKKHVSVLRTFRLSTSLDNALTKDAASKKVGKNALVVSVLNKYVEWDSIVADFGYLYVPGEMLAKLLGSLDKDTISAIAKGVAKKVASSLLVWYGASNLESVLKYMETSVKYSGAHLQQRIATDGKVTRITVYQPFDENGVIWVRAFNSALIENVMGYPPKIVEHSNSIETIIESK